MVATVGYTRTQNATRVIERNLGSATGGQTPSFGLV
jgi:hypothetical protein